MRIDILTLFPSMFAPLKESILNRAQKNKKLEINIINIRDYSTDKHKKCDDAPFGGGAGMLMTPQPIASAIEAIDPAHKAKRIYLSCGGQVFTQKKAELLSREKRIILLCGHYEGIDHRIIELFIDEEISIGDFVLTGGEIPAMVVADCVARHIEGVIKKESLENDSFANGLIEYPQYTRPQEFMGKSVPEILVNGHHAKIQKWRQEQAQLLTKKKRPDLL